MRSDHEIFLDDGANALAAFAGTETALGLDGLGLLGEIPIFDALAKPPRVIAVMQMMQPGLVVDTVGDLQEQGEILGAQIELLLRSAKVEADLRPQITLGVLAQMAASLLAWLRHLHQEGLL